MNELPETLARSWLRAWDTGDLSLLRLAPAITYEVETTAGTFEACDWVLVENGLIREMNSYYDSVTNRAALDA